MNEFAARRARMGLFAFIFVGAIGANSCHAQNTVEGRPSGDAFSKLLRKP
ncbi:MAG: hypothetical protein ACJ8LG_08200 [Massilia sp.]